MHPLCFRLRLTLLFIYFLIPIHIYELYIEYSEELYFIHINTTYYNHNYIITSRLSLILYIKDDIRAPPQVFRQGQYNTDTPTCRPLALG